MGRINWSRVLGCGLLAGIVWIVLGSGVTALLGRDFAALPNNNLGKPTTGFLVFNVVLDLLEGISIMWLYAAIRPIYRPGAKTAVIAAFAWWFIVSLGDATWCSFGFFPPSMVIPLMIGTLPALIIATLVGAKLYKESIVVALIRVVAFDFGYTLVDEEKDASVPLESRPVHLMPEVPEILLRIPVPMAVWANTRTATGSDLQRFLDRAGIGRFFAWVVTSADAGFRKPAPQFFDFALRKCASLCNVK